MVRHDHDNPSDDHESDHVSTDDDDTLFNALINHCSIQKFYIDVTISVEDFVLKTIALFDTGADSNCILEGLIPTKYFHKTSEKLRTASGSRLEIQYKLPSAIIQNDNLQVETPFLLVKNLKNDVILGTPFIKSIFPIKISDEGISTQYLGKTIMFKFLNKPLFRNINQIDRKLNQINFLKEEIDVLVRIRGVVVTVDVERLPPERERCFHDVVHKRMTAKGCLISRDVGRSVAYVMC
ncbi:uncharacterized protein LOC114915238 [Cajanus cajan]|uniref:uncharacterized protein LOC114915238 n=1 Tax=Cajanus cajan TaxID=3821 RepID=UPI0010FB9384|nr:uncharacterized protein LOC114915238 [Cajanus cajan]